MANAPGSVEPGWLFSAGLSGGLAIGLGLIVLLLGLAACIKRVGRGPALALVVVAFIPGTFARLGKVTAEYSAWNEVVKLGPAVTPKDVAHGYKAQSAMEGATAIGLMFGLIGAAAALARSKPDA